MIDGDEDGILLTTYASSDRFPQISIIKGIAFALVDSLLNALGVTTPVHYDVQGCPMDYWADNPSALKLGLSHCDFCPECRSLLVRALSRGQITSAQLAAVYSILDYVADRRFCFVLMPFAAEFQTIYNTCIKRAMTELGWNCWKADELYETREIIEIVWQQIHRAKLVIADLTGRSPNVFYELGYAHAIGKNTILLTQLLKDVPFDLQHRQLIEYVPTEEGCKKLVEALKKYV